jgi:hypothetical protein
MGRCWREVTQILPSHPCVTSLNVATTGRQSHCSYRCFTLMTRAAVMPTRRRFVWNCVFAVSSHQIQWLRLPLRHGVSSSGCLNSKPRKRQISTTLSSPASCWFLTELRSILNGGNTYFRSVGELISDGSQGAIEQKTILHTDITDLALIICRKYIRRKETAGKTKAKVGGQY